MRHRLLTCAAVVAVVASSACGTGGDLSDAVPATVAPPPSTTSTPTTAPPPELTVGADQTLVATATVEEIPIWRDVPEPDAPPAVTLTERADFPPVSTGPRADAPIPTADLGAGGRFLTEAGWAIRAPTDFGNPVVFAVTEQRGRWLRVQLPVRPNGSEGWVRLDDVRVEAIDTVVEVSLSARHLRALRAGTPFLDTPVTIGTGDTPTPTGRYFLTDTVTRTPGGAYGPFVLPISAFSQAMDQFATGAPVIALHGTNRPELLGGAHSNGCIRLPNDAITRLRSELPLGTPVVITA